jgi:hypothetical protein
MVLNNEPTTAEVDPWMVVEVEDQPSLFGFALHHPRTGGRSWVLSTMIVEMNEAADRARTASGRIYALGRRITSTELDEEGTLALRLLLAKWTGLEPPPDQDVRWLTARKMARHLRLEPPSRDDPVTVELFLRNYHEHYVAKRDGRRPH